MFHRRDLPSYFIASGDDLLADYDMINDPGHPSVGGAGVPAPIDGIKGDGPNEGSYMATFGEDGRAIFINRPADALAENTDFLDDIVQSSVPVVIHQDGTAAGATASVLLNSGTGWVYVGPSGMANNAANRDRLIHVTDQTGAELEVSGTKVVCSLLHDGASANVIGTEADGFFEDPTANFSPSIPNGTTYRIHYGTRSSWATQALTTKGSIAEVQIRDAQSVAAEVRRLFRVLHTDAGTEVWNSAFDATVRALAMSGLNERYRRATTQPVGVVTGDYNDAGAGAVITRDGRAVEIQADTNMLIQNTTWKDGNHALLKLGIDTERSDSSAPITGNKGGDFGIWHESEWKADNGAGDAGMFTRGESAGPVLVDVIPYDMRASTFDGDTLFTFIDADDDGATTTEDTFNVDCAAGNYFCLTGPTRTAIRLGLDMVEITDSNGLVRTFYIATIVSATRITVIGPAGTHASPFQDGTDTGCKLRIIQTVISAGGFLGTPSSIFRRALTVIPPAILTTVVANEDIPGCAFFGSQTGSVIDAVADERRARALEWGATASPDSGGAVNGTITARGWLNGDGSAHITRLQVTDVLIGDDLAVAGTASGDGWSIDGSGNAKTRCHVETHPEYFTGFREDWIRFVQEFTPDLIHADTLWAFDEYIGTFTLNNGTPSAKNPGRLEVIGSGGETGKVLGIYKTGQLPYAFVGIEVMVVVCKVDDHVDNTQSDMRVGLFNNIATEGSSTNVLAVHYNKAVANWRLTHLVGGVAGSANNTVLGAVVDNVFVVFRVLRNDDGDFDVYFNESLMVTIAAGDMPAGDGTFAAMFVQGADDEEAITFTNDFWDLRCRASAGTRSGA